MSQQIGKLYPLYSIVWQAAEENEHTTGKQTTFKQETLPVKTWMGNGRKNRFHCKAENVLKHYKVLQPWQGWNYTRFCFSAA